MAPHVTGMSRRAGSACEEPVPGVSCTCGLEPEALAGHPGRGSRAGSARSRARRCRSPFCSGHSPGAGLAAPAQGPSRADGVGPSPLTVQ